MFLDKVTVVLKTNENRPILAVANARGSGMLEMCKNPCVPIVSSRQDIENDYEYQLDASFGVLRLRSHGGVPAGVCHEVRPALRALLAHLTSYIHFARAR